MGQQLQAEVSVTVREHKLELPVVGMQTDLQVIPLKARR
jgi:hypothetical protein